MLLSETETDSTIQDFIFRPYSGSKNIINNEICANLFFIQRHIGLFAVDTSQLAHDIFNLKLWFESILFENELPFYWVL